MKRVGFSNPSRQVLFVVFGAFILYIYLTIRVGGITGRDFLLAAVYFTSIQFNQISPNIRALVFDIVILGAGSIIFWVSYLGQFILPVRTLNERREIAKRLVDSLSIGRGPAIFIRDGALVESQKKKLRKGPGVILLDTASAAVLHNGTAYTRAIGPGLVFTHKKERIAGIVDLRTQIRKIGPSESENPYLERDKKESSEKYDSRQGRRMQTSGLTRDGVEVIPNIIAIFQVGEKRDKTFTQFGYDQDAVWRAIAHEAVDPDDKTDDQARTIHWDWLPVHMAADLWREYLRKFTLNQLFDLPVYNFNGQLEAPRTIFETIVDLVNQRMQQALVNEIDSVGQLTGRKITSEEFIKIRRRGLHILRININSLHLKKEPIERRLIKRWEATWLKRAENESKYIKKIQSIEKHKGEEIGQKEFASKSSIRLYESISKGEKPDIAQSLELLVRGTHTGIVRNPNIHAELTAEERDLVEIIEWIRKERNGTAAE